MLRCVSSLLARAPPRPLSAICYQIHISAVCMSIWGLYALLVTLCDLIRRRSLSFATGGCFLISISLSRGLNECPAYAAPRASPTQH
jgi:hypothetical protein